MLADAIRRVFKVELFYNQQKSAFEKEVARVGAAKYRLDHKEEVSEVLDDLQQQVNARAVAALESLLSAFVADVLPEHRREIKTEVGIARGVPSLKFFAVDEDGNKETIMNGNGGSVTNIVCAGLRMIALVKSHARPFMVLDEGDCWLKPERVDSFYQVLFRVARDLNIQLVVISHHDFSLLRHLKAFDIELRSNGDSVSARYEHFEEEAPGQHFRRIRLENYRSHEVTEIPLHSAITVIHGDNSIGKSAIVDALRAVCYGEADEDVIRHGCDSCIVEIETGDGTLTWERQRKGSPREIFAIEKDGATIHRGPGVRAGVPEFVSDFLRIEKKDGLDIHLTHQKAPVFLLNLPASQQASILSVGAEAGYVPRMIEGHKEMCRKDRDVVKNGEAFLAKTEREILEPLTWAEKADELEARLKDMEAKVTTSAEAANELERLVELAERLDALLGQIPDVRMPEVPNLHDDGSAEQALTELVALEAYSTVSPIESVAEPKLPWASVDECERMVREWGAAEPLVGIEPLVVPTTPTLHDADLGDRLLTDLGQAEIIRGVVVPEMPEAPVIKDEEGMVEFGKGWVAIQKVLGQVSAPEVPSLPVLPDLSPVIELQQNLLKDEQEFAVRQKELELLLSEIERTEREMDILLEKTGGACPVCNSLLKEHRKCA
jgi:hypothetical protein